MKVRYREIKELRDTVLDLTESQFSADELVKQVAQKLRDNQAICFLSIENFDLYEKGASALRHAILGHKSLRLLSLINIRICSYPVCSDDEYFFPIDMDVAIEHLSAILRDGRLHHIEIINIDFHDRTERHFEHFDMVDPSVMRDLLLQEKEPFYIKEILYNLRHNPHLLKLNFTAVDIDLSHEVKQIEDDIQLRHTAEDINRILQGTHASAETYLMPEIFKVFTTWSWIRRFKNK